MYTIYNQLTEISMKLKNINAVDIYISANEAAWRILGYPTHQRFPAVMHLHVHLQNGQRIYFNENNIREKLTNPPKTTHLMKNTYSLIAKCDRYDILDLNQPISNLLNLYIFFTLLYYCNVILNKSNIKSPIF